MRPHRRVLGHVGQVGAVAGRTDARELLDACQLSDLLPRLEPRFAAQGREARAVGRQGDREIRISFWRVGDELAQADVRQDARPAAANDGRAREADHRHAHPQRIEGCCVSVVRERVETDVDALAQVQVVTPGTRGADLDARGIDPVARETIEQAPAVIAGRTKQE